MSPFYLGGDWDTPQWRKIEARLLERKEFKVGELRGAALNSSDPSVRGLAQQLEEIDRMLSLPEEDETEKEERE